MPLWGVGPLPLPGFPMASPLSIGIEIQPAGVDRRWVRLWLLDRSAAPSARCRLVVRSAALRRARELQVAEDTPASGPGIAPSWCISLRWSTCNRRIRVTWRP